MTHIKQPIRKMRTLLLLSAVLFLFPCSVQGTMPTGVFLLGGLGTTTTIGNLANDPITGYAGRVSWTQVDTGTVSKNLVWTYIDALVNGAETYQKPFTLCVHTIVPPPYIVSAADETYTPVIAGDEYTTPVPWDSPSLASQEAFALELAAHVTGAHGALKDNPLFVGVRTSLIGLKGLDEDEGDEMTALATYNRTDFWTGVKRSMHAWADAFPAQAIYVEMAPFDDNTPSPSLDAWLIDQYTAEFDGDPYQRIGVFMESQKGYIPAPTGGAGVNLLHAISHGSYVLFQACGSWLARSPCGLVWPADDYWPENGFNLGYGAYGCTYYEYYNSDLTNAPWQTMLQQWHDFFAGAGAIGRPGPASLSAGTSGSSLMQ